MHSRIPGTGAAYSILNRRRIEPFSCPNPTRGGVERQAPGLTIDHPFGASGCPASSFDVLEGEDTGGLVASPLSLRMMSRNCSGPEMGDSSQSRPTRRLAMSSASTAFAMCSVRFWAGLHLHWLNLPSRAHPTSASPFQHPLIIARPSEHVNRLPRIPQAIPDGWVGDITRTAIRRSPMAPPRRMALYVGHWGQ